VAFRADNFDMPMDAFKKETRLLCWMHYALCSVHDIMGCANLSRPENLTAFCKKPKDP